MALPLKYPGHHHALTMPRQRRLSPLRGEQLKEQFAPSAAPTPLLPRRPMDYIEAYLLHMQQKDMRKRHPNIPPKLFGQIRRDAWGKKEGKIHRRKRQGKISSVYVSKAKRKELQAKARRNKQAARKKVRKSTHPRAI